MFQYDQIEQRYEIQKEKISSTFKDNNQNIVSDKTDLIITTSLDNTKRKVHKRFK